MVPTPPWLTLLCLGGSWFLCPHPSLELLQHHPSGSPGQWPRFPFAPFPILRVCAQTGFWTQARAWFWASCLPGMWTQTLVSKLVQDIFLSYRLHSKCWETASLEAPFQLLPYNTWPSRLPFGSSENLALQNNPLSTLLSISCSSVEIQVDVPSW